MSDEPRKTPRRRAPAPTVRGVHSRRRGEFVLPEGRVWSPEGSWPATVAEPQPPAMGFLYEEIVPLKGRPRAVFGQYPAMLIPRILPWLQCDRREVLHVCSGSLPPGEGIRVDIRADAHPDIIADGRALPFADGAVAAVMLDPPYTKHYARDLYGTDYPRPKHLLAEAARVVRPGGRICFVHHITPNPPKGTRLVKIFALSTGFGFPMRAITIYERRHQELNLDG